MQQKRLMTIFAIISVDLLGFGLILPLIPFYAGQFGATATLVGLLIASYAVAQLVGAPWLGRLSDRYGQRPVYWSCCCSSCQSRSLAAYWARS